jgi:hypothetical protein
MLLSPVTDEELTRMVKLPGREEIFERFGRIKDNESMRKLYGLVAQRAERKMTVIGICSAFATSIAELVAEGWLPEDMSFFQLNILILMFFPVLIDDREAANTAGRYWLETHPEITSRHEDRPS